jgi:hypothetical protein
VRAFALTQNFDLHPAYHKGQRTDACFRFDGLKEAFEKILGTKIANWTHYGTNGCFQFCKGGDELVYHYDTQEYAGVLFLTPDAPPQSGTTFFRSKNGSNDRSKNGSIRRIDSSANIDAIFSTGFLDPSLFDVVDVVGNVYNRLVLFDAKLIHAASSYFGNAKENGRLFQLFFFDIESYSFHN